MAVIIARVTEHDSSNITIGGKVIFVPPEKRNATSINFPVGSVAKVTVEKGNATSIVPPTESEMAAFTRDELAGNNKAPAAIKPAIKTEPTQTPITPPAAKPQAIKEANSEVSETGKTLLQGNQTLVKMEIEIPENWKPFLDDVAGHMRETPEGYWGQYLINHLRGALHDDNEWLFGNLQENLVKKHGIAIRGS
jgi:hypothetical protein